MPRITSVDRELLEAALFGFERKRDDIDQRISALRNHLGGKAHASITANKRSPKTAHDECRRPSPHFCCAKETVGSGKKQTEREAIAERQSTQTADDESRGTEANRSGATGKVGCA